MCSFGTKLDKTMARCLMLLSRCIPWNLVLESVFTEDFFLITCFWELKSSSSALLVFIPFDFSFFTYCFGNMGFICKTVLLFDHYQGNFLLKYCVSKSKVMDTLEVFKKQNPPKRCIFLENHKFFFSFLEVWACWWLFKSKLFFLKIKRLFSLN